MKQIFVLVAASLVVACQSEEPQFDRTAMIRKLGNDVILPAYEDFAAQSATLRQRVRSTCAEPSAANVLLARSGALRARESFARTEVFGIGPHTDMPERFGPKVNTWPVRQDVVNERIAQPVSDAAMLGSTQRGLPVITHLLYAGSEGAVVSAEEMASLLPARCAYLTLLADDIATIANLYVQAWRADGGDFLGELAEGRGRFSSLLASSSALVEQLIFVTENVREMKLAGPLGKKTGTPDFAAQEEPYGQTSLALAEHSIAGVRLAYVGGIQTWLLARKPEVDPIVLDAFAEVEAAFVPVRGLSMEQAVREHGGAVERLYQAIKSLQVILTVDMAAALSVTVTFNPTDGD